MLARNILHIFYKYVTICSVFVIYEKKMEDQKFFFFANLEFLSGIGKKHIFLWERSGSVVDCLTRD